MIGTILGVVLLGTSSLLVSYGFSTHVQFLWGADSSTSVANQKGAQTTVEIQIGAGDHTFSSEQDHNFHIEAKDDANSRHMSGYFVRSTDTTHAKFYAEHWKLVFSALQRDMNFEAAGTIAGADGSTHTFTVYKPSGSWSYILDGTSQTQYTGTAAGTVLNAADTWALAEKVCSPTACDKTHLGNMPTTRFTKAIEYKDGAWWFQGTWNAVTQATAYYETKSADATGSGAQSEMCTPMSMKGDDQSGGPATDNVMDILDGSNTSCTTAGANLWH